MKPPPDLRVIEARDPQAELRSLQRRFRAITWWADRKSQLRRFLQTYARTFGIGAGLFVLVFAVLTFSPFAPVETLKHIGAFPNCDFARAVALAPSKRGEPGYWSRHDRDQDGVACEAYP
jgi:hypothetical protein